MQQLTGWVVTDGKPGMENQALGLAEALGLSPTIKRVRLRSPWRQLGPWLRLGKRFADSRDGDPIQAPWPDLLIATGRHSVIPALSVRQRSRNKTFVVQIQDPAIPARHFDLVVVPEHDRLRGDNVMVTRGALHRVTPALLTTHAARFAPHYDHLPRPRIAVLIGGDSGSYRLTPLLMTAIAEQLAHLARRHGAGLMVTPSRRTGANNEAILREHLRDVPAVVWDGQGDNPYFALLGLADAIVVTSDSVSMVSEACSTGKPVYLVALEGGSPKFQRFHNRLIDDGMARCFPSGCEARLFEAGGYPPLDDTLRVAAEVHRRLAARTRVPSIF